jgi:hypothetical protein
VSIYRAYERGRHTRERFEIVYEKIVVPAAAGVGLESSNALSDGPGMITPGIFRQIRHSHVIVADVTGENTCVGYELAFAHLLARCTVVLVKGDGKLPFDLRDMNRIKYDHEDPASVRKAKEELKEHLREFAKIGWTTANNPIFHAAFAPPEAAPIDNRFALWTGLGGILGGPETHRRRESDNLGLLAGLSAPPPPPKK